MRPLKAGSVFGVVAIVVAIAADLRFLFVDPGSIPNWILTAFESFRTQLALAAYLFLGILAALRARPTHQDPDASYRALLVRDCALAATVVAVMVGVALFVITASRATFLADDERAYARAAAPNILAYNEKVAGRLSNPPPLPTAGEIEGNLQPPVLNDLGHSMGNIVLGALVLGVAGAAVGALRGSFGSGRNPEGQGASSAQKEGASEKRPEG